jgi:N-acetylneuraminic acid mutarotase
MHPRRLSLLAVAALLLGGLLVGVPGSKAEAIWTPAAPLATHHAGHSATLLPDGQVLVAGAETAERYDPSTDRWHPAGRLTTYRNAHTATLLPDGQVLLVGGFALPFDGTAATERYNPATGTWTAAAPLGTPRIGHTATLLRNGKVLVVGGTPDAKNTGLATAELYDPTTDRWTPAGALVSTRVGHTATLLADGTVLVVGGATLGGGVGAFLATAERYDPATDRWTPAGSFGAGRYGHQAILLANGHVLIIGGVIANTGEKTNATRITDTTMRYDPATRGWTPGAPLTVARVGHTATLLPNGRVLVTGGDRLSMTATTELYDPATDRWSASAPMGSTGGGTATLLANGRVLVVGETLAELYTADAPAPPRRCFAETGRCVQGRFLAYWEAHGGLALNGYPLGEEISQNLEDGQTLIVQYFERTRLEYHPRNVGTPYEVQLSQFGRRILATVPNAPTAPVSAEAGYRYFPETGHNVGPRFAAYWESHGNLAQFGYPLTEPFEQALDDGKPYTVQYFERARFEYHPENATPYDVLLGQFGRRILAETPR